MKIYKKMDKFDYIMYRNEKGQLHRPDGPAIEHNPGNGYKAWWINGKRHRIDGPAVEYPDGSKQWWINGLKLTEEEFKRRTTKLYKLLYK